jgi:hypothetical protein
MSTITRTEELHRGRLVLGVLMLLLAAVSLVQQAGLVTLDARYLAPGLLVAAGLVLLVSSVGRGHRAGP